MLSVFGMPRKARNDAAGLLRHIMVRGHFALMGTCNKYWKNTEYVLSLLGQKVSEARHLISKFVEEGVSDDKRHELII